MKVKGVLAICLLWRCIETFPGIFHPFFYLTTQDERGSFATITYHAVVNNLLSLLF